jgi:D-3-phosphoglycerate dehydrogenase
VTDPLLVVATDRVSAEGLGPLADTDEIELEIVDDSSSDDFNRALSRAAGLIVRSATRVDAAMIASAPALRVIGRAGVGVDNIDLAAATKAGVAVFNAPGGNTIAAAELTMALILTTMRKVAAADRSVRDGKWERSAFKGGELYGRILGLVGAGRIGAEVARRSRAFGMDVIAYDPYLPEATAAELSIRLTGFDEVIEAADVISCHVPLNDETRGLISADALGRMKATAVVVNASRGGVVDESALVEALEAGSIAGAALDVYEAEPLPPDSPLRAAPNLVMTPHLGASTDEAQVRVAVEVAEAMARALLDGDLTGAVNRS